MRRTNSKLCFYTGFTCDKRPVYAKISDVKSHLSSFVALFFSLLSCLFFLFFFFLFFYFKGLTFGALEPTPLPLAALLAVVSLTFHI